MSNGYAVIFWCKFIGRRGTSAVSLRAVCFALPQKKVTTRTIRNPTALVPQQLLSDGVTNLRIKSCSSLLKYAICRDYAKC